MRHRCSHFPGCRVFPAAAPSTWQDPAAWKRLWRSLRPPYPPYPRNPTGACLGAGTMQNAPLTGNAGSMQPFASVDDRSGTAVTGFPQWEIACFGSLAWLMLI